MAPPLPDASIPSKRTQTGGPMPASPSLPPSASRRARSRLWPAFRAFACSFLLSLSERSSSSRRPMAPILAAGQQRHAQPPRQALATPAHDHVVVVGEDGPGERRQEVHPALGGGHVPLVHHGR